VLVAALATVGACLLGAGNANAASQTVIGFDNLPVGTIVSKQYELQGLELGRAEEFGQPSPGAGDCGSPSVGSGAALAFSEPNYGLLATCRQGASAPAYSGTYGVLSAHPKGSLSVEVRDLKPVGGLAFNAKIVLIGYGASGNVLARGEGTAEQGAWTQIVAAQVGGTEAQLSYLSIRTAEANEDPIGIDNLTYETVEASKKEETKKEGSSGGSGTGSALTPPTAVLKLETPNPHKGEALTLSGAASSAGSGHIISYGWDFNNDGTIDTSTGTNPIAHVMLPPGNHTIALTVTNSEGKSSTARLGVAIAGAGIQVEIPDGGQGECQSSLTAGAAQILAECIQTLAGGGYVIQSKQLDLNGMVLVPKNGGAGIFKVTKIRDFAVNGFRVVMSGPAVNVELLNTPIGDLVLGGYDLETEPLELGIETVRLPNIVKIGSSFSPERAHAAGSNKGLLLMALGAGKECESGSKEVGCCPPAKGTTACATLPGGFPFAGEVLVYLDNKGRVLIDVQVSLNLHEVGFEASGELEIVAGLETGIDLGSLKFEIPEASMASVFKVKNASFQYYFPEDPEVSKRDTWQAKAGVFFAAIEEAGIEGELSFKKGQFHSASLLLNTGNAGIPIYPGILLNKFGGSVQVEPLVFGGTLGASIAQALELTLEFRYAEPTEGKLGYFGGKGSLALEKAEIASLMADVYSDGYVDAQLKINLKIPFESNEPIVEVGGGIGFWDEPSSGLWEASGNVYVKIWIINAEVAGLVNNKYIAACGNIDGAGGYDDYDFQESKLDGPSFFLFSNCTDQLKKFKEKPEKEHKGGFVGEGSRFDRSLGPDTLSAAASTTGGETTVQVPKGQLGQEFKIFATSGTPIVTFTGPGGQTFTTPSAPGKVESSADYVAALGNNPDELIVLLRHPQAGTWHLARAAGSAPVREVQEAQDVAPATIHASALRVHRSNWKLSYKIDHYVAGTKVTFVEHGKDTTHVLGSTSTARGVIRFVPQDGISRARTITAALTNTTGATVRVFTVGSYTAPPAFRPARPRHLRITRHGSTATVTWSPAAGARIYWVKVTGSDGRLRTYFAKPGHLSERLANVIPNDSFTATVIAVGGPSLLPGPVAKANLKPARVKRHASAHGRAKKR
jgi:PKD repeat protein